MSEHWDRDQPTLSTFLSELDLSVKPMRKPRKLTLAAALRQAAKVGASVARVEITGDKTTLIMGEPEPTEASNPWLAEIDKVTKQ